MAASYCTCSGCSYNADAPGELPSQILEANGFPSELLPAHEVAHCEGAITGPFSINFKRPIDAVIDGYNVHYDQQVTGTVEHGWIRQVTGIKVFYMMAWVPVDTAQIGASCGNRLYFYVGRLVYKSVALSAFPGLWEGQGAKNQKQAQKAQKQRQLMQVDTSSDEEESEEDDEERWEDAPMDGSDRESLDLSDQEAGEPESTADLVQAKEGAAGGARRSFFRFRA
ncbi:hypothetical protein CLOM_g14913 [Closterium sp. NIES-68]|nr:hypothetical protein CLOM_g14913 [Closterium sp. NIES-68]GJP75523.1 hypothetical protein CLOP_g5958 [Closterium sp. NIES-67]